MAQAIVQVDAFTAEPFRGNPAAVCLLDSPRDDGWMQAVAKEMNLSETAFLLPESDGYRLRWFTPEVEVDLCGHATLASAHVLREEGLLAPGTQAKFHTRSGLLTAKSQDDRIELDFPAEPAARAEPPAALLAGLRLRAGPKHVARNRFDYLVELDTAEAVRQLSPDFALLREVEARGIIVCAASDSPDYDFVSRFFGPAVGVDEDPVTGSAHCCLGPYWGERLGKGRLTGFQASARGGVVGIELREARILLSGQAVTVLRGELLH